ncbi:envelope stress response membrane protein PspC [Kordiimonas marina]|uniref:envelope stress response membrane protein PspC n=1 Tax=Kordiimonas marina TaxID=2872312 RepID=UPI001FF50C9C|nr:envelope stress response membrane protein PspC [Kordiimonas marina]MCJ9428286.1 envelope stress response membrane protein PspC [Kordiimonas marina]
MTNFNKRPTRLYKDPRHGRVMGVCAGLSDYFSMNVRAIRILAIIGVFMSGGWLILAYLVLGFALDPKPEDLYTDDREEEFWRQTRRSPDYTAAELRRRFRDIERRTADMEAYMTSKRFRLERELKALED